MGWSELGWGRNPSWSFCTMASWNMADREAIRTRPGRFKPGPLLKVEAEKAQRLLQQSVRLVADLPKESSGDVVWVQGASELLVRTGSIGLDCREGLITVTLIVACDQLREDAPIDVPFAVGTERAPAGLVMSALTRPVGVDLVIDEWSSALTAFAWEALIHLAQMLCAQQGSFVPASIAAGRGVLLILPVERRP